ncbi:MAG TPA: aldolase/citrate lyase family protein [Alphaproteobacteria bacterium]|nr:aldolase/citrate lyase family protein [Alphaproteobacteria bacterium]
MRTNPVRERLMRGEAAFGPMIMECASPGLPQIFAGAGADFIMYDQEAGCLDIATIKAQTALCRGLGIVPMVNVPWHDYHLLVRPLDCGAMGLLVPVVETRAQAEAIVRVSHYPPNGVRGVAFGIAHDDYAGVDIAEAMKIADERTLIAVKIETGRGVEHIEEIASAPGVDVAFVGHMDLSVSLGVPGQYDHEIFVAAVDRVIGACKAHGKTGGCLVTTVDAARRWMAKGFRFVIYSTDVILLSSSFRAAMDGLKSI